MARSALQAPHQRMRMKTLQKIVLSSLSAEQLCTKAGQKAARDVVRRKVVGSSKFTLEGNEVSLANLIRG
jgi:hypothetical protein